MKKTLTKLLVLLGLLSPGVAFAQIANVWNPGTGYIQYDGGMLDAGANVGVGTIPVPAAGHWNTLELPTNQPSFFYDGGLSNAIDAGFICTSLIDGGLTTNNSQCIVGTDNLFAVRYTTGAFGTFVAPQANLIEVGLGTPFSNVQNAQVQCWPTNAALPAFAGSIDAGSSGLAIMDYQGAFVDAGLIQIYTKFGVIFDGGFTYSVTCRTEGNGAIY